MFGPNKISNFSHFLSFSHRTEKFKEVFKETTNALKDKFDLHDFDVLFVPGSGTTAMEVVLSSLKISVNVVGHEGKFKDRWRAFLNSRNKLGSLRDVPLFCQLETSTGQFFEKPGGIIDAISAFPYYKIPPNTKCFVTCSNKQLGAFPGLGIICVRKDSWDMFCPKKDYFTTRDLSLYRERALINQTPTTCPTQIFEHLLCRLRSFDLDQHRESINDNCNIIREVVEKIENQMPCPVINIDKKHIKEDIAKKYEIYNHNNSSEIYQIFSYSNDREQYKKLRKDLLT